ncbi:LLM class flavin-dependent oxidoreductase [Homoserinibacter sp. YIM 151385]|uniref:LLM class flavin-dependent oxidoreductase n=1 Tax=Homoserinibacter sp. YIM 151385 TaxID=2985506 RepID=UPI0022F133C0|nr:LLM class flavin-dependent oxidoreductase [Homoserinibacter sp. YIM 151385]WBU39008.1 LLM class flavin-dependent oxidoreductase [Homoserinibacter sp. YIM 151385]
MNAPRSVLDLAPVRSGSDHAEALADTIAVAQAADRLGYERFWVAEHHGMPMIASSSPAVLIGAIAAATERIRVGSGGVMLPNHSSLVVAEQFGTLVALHGERIDLGLGRAAGTDPVVSAAIRRGLAETVDDFPQQVIELLAHFGTIPALESGEGSRILALPGLGDAPQLWLLGSSDFSARLAGMMGLPFAFAHHFAGGAMTEAAMRLYREAFTPSVVLREPRSAIAVATAVAETPEEARRIALPQSLTMLKMRSGQPLGRIPTVEEAEAYPWTDAEAAWVDQRLALQAVGTVEHVEARLAELLAQTAADEVILAPQGADRASRIAALEALATPAAG